MSKGKEEKVETRDLMYRDVAGVFLSAGVASDSIVRNKTGLVVEQYGDEFAIRIIKRKGETVDKVYGEYRVDDETGEIVYHKAKGE